MTPPHDHSATEAQTSAPQNTIKVWDIPVRVFHWLMVLLFIAAYITNTLGPTYFHYHVWCGYALILLVCFRILWGFIGTYHARFSHFLRNPIHTLKYALDSLKGKEKHYTGHNPLGAIMVVILLGGTLLQGITGLFANDEILNVGPLYAYVTDALSLKLTAIHQQAFYWIVGAIILHVLAVLVHQFIKRDKIIQAMFTGKKTPASDAQDQVSIGSSRILLAVAVLIGLAALLAALIITAPEAVLALEDY